jgi:hypothetical protein
MSLRSLLFLLFFLAVTHAACAADAPKVQINEPEFRVLLDYQKMPYIAAATPRTVSIKLENPTQQPSKLTLSLAQAPATWQITGIPAAPVELEPGASKTVEISLTAPEVDPQTYDMNFEVSNGAKTVRIPCSLTAKEAVQDDDFALASKGATVRVDGEFDPKNPSAKNVIDGVIASVGDPTNRWRSSIERPHPHWVEITLPKPQRLGRIIIHFADPADYAIDFNCYARPAGQKENKRVLQWKGNTLNRAIDTELEPIIADLFVLEITKSGDLAYPNAAQISEIELLPPRK